MMLVLILYPVKKTAVMEPLQLQNHKPIWK